MYLSIEGITKRFGTTLAVRDLSLAITEAELVCFLGPSGCGKTTLLRLIAGLEQPDAGCIRLAGSDLAGIGARDRNFGMVFQSYSLFPSMTVGRNVAYGLECRRWPAARIADRVAEMLSMVGLSGEANRHPQQLSGGQQQRVALARALAPEPRVLLLDEPLSALDAKVRLALRGEVRRLQKRLGITTILVTHDQEEALTMADRIVLMNAGVIEQIGEPTELYGNPATAFVADFVGTMNFLEAVALGGDRVRLACGVEQRCTNWRADASPGTPVKVAIRPEDVRFGDEAGATGGIPASVGWVEFLGASFRVDLHLPGATPQTLRVQLPPSTLRERDLGEGVDVSIALPAEHLWVYPA